MNDDQMTARYVHTLHTHAMDLLYSNLNTSPSILFSYMVWDFYFLFLIEKCKKKKIIIIN